jgi:hypothetical protein
VTPDRQLALFPAGTTRQPVTPALLILAKRLARTVRARGPLRVADLSIILGAEAGDTWLAAGIARQWRKVDVRDGVVSLAAPGGEGMA